MYLKWEGYHKINNKCLSGAAARTLIAKKNVDNKYIKKVFGKVTTKLLQHNMCIRKSNKYKAFGKLV